MGLTVLLAAGCAPSHGHVGEVGGGAPATLAPPPGADTSWTTDTVKKAGTENAPAVLQSVSWARMQGYDRVVFEFRHLLPGYLVAEAPGAITACGSGLSLNVGPSALKVHLRPAQAHDTKGRVTVPHRIYPHLGVISNMRLTCDFGSDLTWGLAVPGARPFRVFGLTSPPRIVVDVRDAP